MKKKQRNQRPKNYVKVPDDQKLNPNSLCSLLLGIVNEYFGANYRRGAIALRKFSGTYRTLRGDSEDSGDERLKRICMNEQYIAYSDLESIARHLEIPTGILLVFSRMRANMEKGRDKEIENAKILAFFEKLAVDYRYGRNELTMQFEIKEFKRWVEEYAQTDPIPSQTQMQMQLEEERDRPPKT